MPLPYSSERAPPPRMHQRVVRPHRRGPGPHLVIEVGRRRDVGRILARAHVVVAVDLDQADGPELAFADDAIARGDQVRRAAPLRADLHDAVVFARGGEHRLPFGDVHADRLLHVDVRARLRRPRSSPARASDRAWRSGRCRDPSPRASCDSRCRCAASSSTPDAWRPSPRRSSASSNRRRRARRLRRAPPESAGRGRPCHTSRGRSGRRVSSRRCRRPPARRALRETRTWTDPTRRGRQPSGNRAVACGSPSPASAGSRS